MISNVQGVFVYLSSASPPFNKTLSSLGRSHICVAKTEKGSSSQMDLHVSTVLVLDILHEQYVSSDKSRNS